MTPKISFVIIPVLAGLALAPAAWGNHQYGDAFDNTGADRQEHADFWNYDQQTGKKITNASPGVVPQGLATLYSAGRDVSAPIGSPDAFERAVAATLALQSNSIVSPDAFERAVAARHTTGSSLIFDNHRLTQPTNADRRLVGDNYRDVPKPVSRPAPIVASDSGRDIDWPQIGIGFGVGILLALGLFLAMRYTRIRPLAH